MNDLRRGNMWEMYEVQDKGQLFPPQLVPISEQTRLPEQLCRGTRNRVNLLNSL